MDGSNMDMKIVSIAKSKKKGTPKVQVEKASLLEGHGIEGDAHAGPWHRQVSFLAAESIEESRKKRKIAAALYLSLQFFTRRKRVLEGW